MLRCSTRSAATASSAQTSRRRSRRRPAVDAELAAEIGASVYRVGIYCSIRDPHGRLEQFKRTVKQTASEFHALTNARVIRGRRLCLPGFTSTLPIGVDELRATRSYAQRNIAHCVALTSSRCGSPGGVIVGTADPGGTIERADPFDPVHPRRVTLIVGPSGGGKTVLTNALCLRYIAQGGRTFILDRSSTPDEHGNTKGTGHYDTLASLIPGSRRVQVGHAGGDVICPWDVADPGRVPAHKTELLLALHALLIGHAHDPEGRVRTLDSDEETLIRTGIEAAYRLASETGERPREQLLIDVLTDRATSGSLTGANADRLQSLLLRLEPYGEAGSLAHIADRATTVPVDTPLTLFDFTGLSERLTPALMLATVEYVERQVQRLRRARVDGALDHLGTWAGKCQLIVEEGWALTQSPAAGAWLNEYARRSRHYALWLMFVSQHFRDLSNEQGRALLANGALSFCLRNDRDDLEHAREPLGLSDTDIAQIQALPKQHGVYSTVYMVSARGRGAVRVALGDLEYWICSSDPEHDQPRRAAALRESAGEPWAALDRLCTPTLARAIPPGERSRGMTDHRHALVGDDGRRRHRKAPWLLAAGAFMIVISPVVLFAGAGNPPCQAAVTGAASRRVWFLDRHRVRTTVGRDERERHHRDRPEPHRRPACVRDRRRPVGDPAPELRARHPQPVRHAPRFLRRRHRRRDHRPPRRHLRLARAAPLRTPGASATSPSRPRRTPAPATSSGRSPRPRRASQPRRRQPPCARPRWAGRSRSPLGSRRRSSRAGSPPRRATRRPPSSSRSRPGNQLISKPYIWGGGHGIPLSQLDSGYDCSGATSYILHGAGGATGCTPRTPHSSRATASPDPERGSPSTRTRATRSSPSPGSS